MTRDVLADGGPYTLELRIPVDADRDGRFKAECLDTGETLWVNGWLFTFEDLND